MKTSAETATRAIPDNTAKEPGLWALILLFWGAFAAAVAITAVLNPDMFVRKDPDSLMRLVQVRDLLAGQGWFDLMQYRIDPPDGALMHWSRVIDAPVAALILLGDLFGAGETFALIAWPLILFLGLMAGVALSSTALAGRRAAVPTLILSLVFLDPLLFFLPNDIDHHNAQYALIALMLAAALRLGVRPALGAVLGGGCALMLSIGLEMLPYVAIFGGAVAVLWALRIAGVRATALFGVTFAAAPAALYLLTGLAAAPFVCDSLSWAFVLPAAVAGLGLAGLALAVPSRAGVLFRIGALAGLGGVACATLLAVAPQCLSGPYGTLSPELKAVWLDTISEAKPFLRLAAEQPIAAITALGPTVVALAVALYRVWSGPQQRRVLWALPLALLGMAIALSFYQVRTLPYANVAAIAVLGAWLGELAARHGMTSLLSRAAVPVIVGFLVACPLVHLMIGWIAVDALAAATDGRIAPLERPSVPEALTAGQSNAEKECLDPASAALLESVPAGLVLAPVFYGPTVLMLSPHSVVAGPYHRAGEAILDTFRATHLPPAEARRVIEAHDVDYVAICSTARESAIAIDKAPGGLLAALLAGEHAAWLEPVPAGEGTTLRLWRVTGLRGTQS